MMDAIERYLRLRRTAGFALSNAEYLLASFARFAAKRNEMLIRTQTAIEWAAQGPSAAQRDPAMSALRMIGMSCRRRIILGGGKSAGCRTSTRRERSTASLKPQLNSARAARCGLTLTRLCSHCWLAPGCESPRRWACDLPMSQLMDC